MLSESLNVSLKPTVKWRSAQEWLNRQFDKVVRPEVHLFHLTRSAFLIFGYVGLALAVLVSMLLVMFQGLSIWIMLAIVVTAVATFLALVMLTKIITGEEYIVCYHQQIAVTLVTAGLLGLLHQPILPYLDATMLGVGLFIACGRVGCLMVGCCHGRPHSWGVCYRQEHADAGFPAYLAGVRLFPIQAVESGWLFASVVVGSFLVLAGRLPGEALAWYALAYSGGRFCVEFFRGDAVRLYLWGFSEAQWTSLLVMVAVLGAEAGGILPFQPWHAAVVAGFVLVATAVALNRRLRKTARHRLLHPHHVREVAEIIGQATAPGTRAGVASGDRATPITLDIYSTSQGIRISASAIHGPAGPISHYALSLESGTMSQEVASLLARLIIRLRHSGQASELIAGNQGVFHLVVHPATVGNAA
ncbi:MAG: prolipoprotein diacylglyceryl transferase [Chloroflexi bacterium]|nr:prolipoprotein diacylglyceryl transferase [Chloroflexota bacterium]MCI0575344.1 prolipoprotein diacylglyceryl transferase [Chloroflexota bacterium]MCI0645818.1 prolipoprotein diacylglyceryl transferase [Chloroflexota bacterium]MCI0730970.1 prolipoprotein diacylglyceryl transferase [Chloroflexota bacterium]